MRRLPNVDYTKECRDCGKLLCFSSEVRAESGSRVPLNTDFTRHTCEPDEEFLISKVIALVRDTNFRLKTCYLAVERRPVE
jgi:hypothetical protein